MAERSEQVALPIGAVPSTALATPEPSEGSVGLVVPQRMTLPGGLSLACGARTRTRGGQL